MKHGKTIALVTIALVVVILVAALMGGNSQSFPTTISASQTAAALGTEPAITPEVLPVPMPSLTTPPASTS